MNTHAVGPLLAEAELTLDPSGQPASARYGDIYASRAGALGQARAVYLRGCGLLDSPARWAGQSQFTILETGFGLGVNFLATCAAWCADPQRCTRLDYVSLELHPVRAADLLAHAPPELKDLAAMLAAQWPPPVRGLHVITLDAGNLNRLLTHGQGKAASSPPRGAGQEGHFSDARSAVLTSPTGGGGREGHLSDARSAVLTSPTCGGGWEG
ncbi:MAG: tRNA (5-methylaminomethyl-2-thiouridine)(34)-methyltransferase MnmD, partial [Thiomonas sp.]